VNQSSEMTIQKAWKIVEEFLLTTQNAKISELTTSIQFNR